jgi:hypothetical protein
MSIIKRTIEQEVRICDSCKSVYNLNTDLPICHICNCELCFSCQEKLGTLTLCSEHHKFLWGVIKQKKKELENEKKSTA